MRHILFFQASIAAALLLSACGLEERLPVEMVQMEQSRPLSDEASLDADVRLDVGSIEISGESSSKLYALDLEYDKANYQPEINYDQAGSREGRLFFKLEGANKFRSQRHANRLRLNLSDALPVSLRINNGVGESRLALSRLRLTRLDLEAGVGGAKLSAYEPNAPAVEAGLQRHDLVLRVGEVTVRTLDDYARAVRTAKRGDIIRLLVARYARPGPGCEDRVSYLWVAFAKR